MSIVPLPEATVRNLGSSLVITSPVLLLKELVDNAIDAGATSIDVLVSPNTVDKIEVRDNGHGISPADFGYLACPGHTSKLRSLDELDALGGRTLGFRGVALASVNNLANVSLSTRVSTEHVAAVISLAKGGGVDTLRHAGAPVGTAVCVTDLFSHLPVRSQVTVREAPKNLTRMKELLQSYALTRPTVKLRFTVLKTPSLSWSYAPAANSDVKAAAIQIFGTELASQCSFETYPSKIAQDDDKLSSNQNVPGCLPEQATKVVFEALLPRPTADPQKISKGAFISVDARPVSAARGTAKKLVSIFKGRIEGHFASARSIATPKSPFIRLNIRCPPGSYDVNVEPSKDDVLFKAEHHIIDQFESFLSYVYPATRGGPSHLSPITATETDVEAPGGKAAESFSPCPSPQTVVPPWGVDMSSGFDGISDDEAGEQINADTRQDIRQVVELGVDDENIAQSPDEGLNPWSLAKLTGKTQSSAPRHEGPVQNIHWETRLRLLESGATDPLGVSSPSGMQEPDSTQSPPPRPGRHGRRENPASQGRRVEDLLGHKHDRSTVRSARLPNQHNRPSRYHGLRSPPTSSPHEQDRDRVGIRDRPRPQSSAKPGRTVQSRLSFDRNNSRPRRHRDHPDLDRQSPKPARPNRRARNPASTRLVDLEDMDFITETPVRTSSADGSVPRQPSPSHRSLLRNIPGVGESAREVYLPRRPDKNTTQPPLQLDDPRVRLIEQQRLMTTSARKKPKRLTTGRLPLETIPRDSETCALSLTVAADARSLAQLLTEASQFDTWLVDGELRGAFDDGPGPKDTARLMEPLLAQLGYGTAASAQTASPLPMPS
ncbi:uncharacterized protein B0H64DRAFT_318308 [Chaetomium fimeti]|uniref:DNA mismatch repair protein S5 domain-containing protein n=1 Tax=Chaetomium fimeti TaxID=1854472 RepID=A0AAE0HME2_9PEZI|nr:hypothetical protein B0H64DRAFT_318308 [Chaetomium fimeti]